VQNKTEYIIFCTYIITKYTQTQV